MSEPFSKSFDCVQSMRETRDKLGAEIADMSYAELAEWLRAHKYADPLLQRLAEMAGRRGDESDRPCAGS